MNEWDDHESKWRGCEPSLVLDAWVLPIQRKTERVPRQKRMFRKEIHDERTKGAPRIPCSGNAESRERQTRRYLVGLHAARRVRRGARHLRADLANSHFHNPDTHDRSLLPGGRSARIGGGATGV